MIINMTDQEIESMLDKMSKSIEEIKSFIIGDFKTKGMNQRIDEIENRLSELETLKKQGENLIYKLIGAAFTGSGFTFLIKYLISLFGG